MAKAAPAKSQPIHVEPDLAPTPSPSPARLLIEEQLVPEADLAHELDRTTRAVSNLAKKHGLRHVKILRRVYYRRDDVRNFLARIGQTSRRRR